MNVPSTDGVELAVHDLGGTGGALLVSHATGFHGRCYQPLADELAAGHRCIAFDYRGHGDTARPPGGLDWQQFGDDAEAMAQWLAQKEGGPIDAFGHSMGGACLLMAAHRRPELFRRIVAFEPIVFPPVLRADDLNDDPTDNTMVQGARRRRSTFPSYAAAIANYSSKPPLNAFTPQALAAYVHHGFAPDGHGHVHLKCTTDTEATTFAGGPTHDTWQHLPAILTNVIVVAGRTEPMQPSAIAAQIAEQLPNGRYEQNDDLDHFGPMTHPREMAQIVAAALAR